MKIAFAVKDARTSLIAAMSEILGKEVVPHRTYAAGGYLLKCTTRQRTKKGANLVNIRFNMASAGRKAFARAVGEILGVGAVYCGTPSFAYQVGGYVVDRGGELVCPADTETEEADRLIAALSARGYEAEKTPDYYALRMTEREELELGRERRDLPGEDGPQANAVSDDDDEHPDIDQHHPGRYANPNALITPAMVRQWEEASPWNHSAVPDTLAIEMPLDGFTPEKLDNLNKLVESKASLIKKALGAAELPVRIVNDRLTFPWFTLTGADGEMDAYARFITALCKMAKEQKRITAKDKETGNDKFTMRLFLIRLGFIGPELKTARKILLRNLTGNTAWKHGQRPERAAVDDGGAGEEPLE